MQTLFSQHGDLHFGDVKKDVNDLLLQIEIVQTRQQRKRCKEKEGLCEQLIRVDLCPEGSSFDKVVERVSARSLTLTSSTLRPKRKGTAAHRSK